MLDEWMIPVPDEGWQFALLIAGGSLLALPVLYVARLVLFGVLGLYFHGLRWALVPKRVERKAVSQGVRNYMVDQLIDDVNERKLGDTYAGLLDVRLKDIERRIEAYDQRRIEDYGQVERRLRRLSDAKEEIMNRIRALEEERGILGTKTSGAWNRLVQAVQDNAERIRALEDADPDGANKVDHGAASLRPALNAVTVRVQQITESLQALEKRVAGAQSPPWPQWQMPSYYPGGART